MLAAILLLLLVASKADPTATPGWPLGLQSGYPTGDDAITVCGRRRDPERDRVKRDPNYEIDHPVEHGWGDLSRDMDICRNPDCPAPTRRSAAAARPASAPAWCATISAGRMRGRALE